MNVLLFLLVGLAAGFVAAKRTRAPMSLPAALAAGVVGALVGGFLFGGLGLAARGVLGSMVTATTGAVLLTLLAGSVPRRT